MAVVKYSHTGRHISHPIPIPLYMNIDIEKGIFMPIPPHPDDRKRAPSRHSINLDRRENVTVTGVIDVISFDEESVIAESEMGVIIIKGGNLHVKRINLENGELVISGEIDGLTYENPGMGVKGKTLIGRLFK